MEVNATRSIERSNLINGHLQIDGYRTRHGIRCAGADKRLRAEVLDALARVRIAVLLLVDKPS
jgi:hypothetical protein